MTTPDVSMAAALAEVDRLRAERDAAQRKYEDCKAELDNVLPIAQSLAKSMKLLLDVSASYKAQSEHFEERAEEAERECEELIEDNAALRGQVQGLEGELVAVRSERDSARISMTRGLG